MAEPVHTQRTGGFTLVEMLAAIPSVVWGFIGLVVLFGIASPHFLTTDNLLNVMQQSAINAILGIGLTFVIISGGIDLSVGSILALCGLDTADLLVTGSSMPVAILGASGPVPSWQLVDIPTEIYEAVRELNPSAIMLRMPAFGLDGPWRDRAGFAMTVEQASGLAWITGYDDLPLVPRGPCDPIGLWENQPTFTTEINVPYTFHLTGADPNNFPGNVEVCDEDGHDEDCMPETFGFLDADGDVDLAVATHVGVSVLLNDGAGGFPSESVLDVGASPDAIAAGGPAWGGEAVVQPALERLRALGLGEPVMLER